MKIAKFLSIVCALVMLFSISTSVIAATETETESLPGAGITPDSPFYFMDKWTKQIAMAFTFGVENKVQKALQYADERLAEIRDMTAQNKFQEATQAGNQYQYCLQIATQKMEQAKSMDVNTAEKMALMLEKHLELTNRVSNNLAQEAQTVMTQTREKAGICQETALKKWLKAIPNKQLV